MRCVGKVERRGREMAGLVCESLLPCARHLLKFKPGARSMALCESCCPSCCTERKPELERGLVWAL